MAVKSRCRALGLILAGGKAAVGPEVVFRDVRDVDDAEDGRWEEG